jgi:DNA polymerase-1
MHEGSLALCKMECVGLPVCREELSRAKDAVTQQIRSTEQQMRSMDEYQRQRKKFGIRTKIGSREQLADILYKDLNYPGMQVNPKTGKIIFDDEVLNEIDTPYTKLFKKVQKFHKLNSTYLTGIERELCGDRVHAVLNTHTVTTYRSSADSPNIQNFPIRDPEIGQILRSIIRPKPGKVIVEIDYSALEVHIAACYHRDPTMIEYLETGHDMHKDVAMECYKLDKIEKPIRTAVKSYFTFAEFYGDYYASIARNLWKYAETYQMESGKLLTDHLREKGIVGLGHEEAMTHDSYMQYIYNVDKAFWEQRFPVYDRWRKNWYQEYQRNGYFYTLTGFRVWGVYKRNEVINNPVQGSAFHCLLRSIIEITKKLEQSTMRSQLIGQIHDSLLAEVPIEELDDYVAMATHVMTTWLKQTWPWIIVDLKTEVEVGESWAAKQPYSKT